MKNKLKELWAKIKIYLPLIGVIGLVCSMILGLFCFTRCEVKDNIARASASTMYNPVEPINVVDTQALSTSLTLYDEEATASIVYSHSGNYFNLPCGRVESISFNAPNLSGLSAYPVCAVSDLASTLKYNCTYLFSFSSSGNDGSFPVVIFDESRVWETYEDGKACYKFTYTYYGEDAYLRVGYAYNSVVFENFSITLFDGDYDGISCLQGYCNYVYYQEIFSYYGLSSYTQCEVDHEKVYEDGYIAGQEDCASTHADIYASGVEKGRELCAYETHGSFCDGSSHSAIHEHGYSEGQASCERTHEVIINKAYYDGYDNGHADGNLKGHEKGYEEGYNDAYDVAYETLRDEVETEVLQDKNTFMDLIFGIMDAPVRIIRDVFNFEIFGINVSDTVFFFLTAVIVVFVIKKIRGG